MDNLNKTQAAQLRSAALFLEAHPEVECIGAQIKQGEIRFHLSQYDQVGDLTDGEVLIQALGADSWELDEFMGKGWYEKAGYAGEVYFAAMDKDPR